MEKINLGSTVPAYPMPVSLVGAHVDGKPNFLAIAWFTMVSYNPPRIAAALGRGHYTNPGIKENKAFSVCLPSEDMVEVTDYCGIVSGKKTDKSEIFDLFYGELKTAPMIKDCPLCMECKVVDVVESSMNEIFIGEIMGTYTEERYLSDGKLDFRKMNPLILSQPDTSYWRLGEPVAAAWSIGKKYKASRESNG
ncbi:MAG: flavin reductase family protein [Desulfatiglandaceae bacterium]|jgi:flavin reductase (DIM6/NTAB) family NADH-FMN oxidoreductase RutF